MTEPLTSHALSINELVPHQDPMLLIDTLIEVDESHIHTQVTICEQGLFFNRETQAVPGYVGIEFMAQSVAAWSGYQCKLKGKPPEIGFLLGTRRYKSTNVQFELGQTYDIYAEHLMDNNGMAAFACQIQHQGQEIASAQLNAFVPSPQQLNQMLSQ
ncbi:hotdog family protein [Vibrio gangliei]|uniref:hotdog family protein n=1 Tax=Vibrio gangliei TaxID=2077090 RepID=UPI000D01FE0D|nr:hotdog family protein [Vibrio gangliei]